MATRYAVQTGFWSETSTWDGGTLPQAADDVYADGKIVTIDQNVIVLSLRNTLRSGGTNGGGFTVGSTYTITAVIYSGTVLNTQCINVTAVAPANPQFIGNVVGSVGGINCYGIRNSATATVNVTGAITGGSGGNAVAGIYSTTNGTIDVSGNIVANGSMAVYSIGATSVNRLRGNIVCANKKFPFFGTNFEIDNIAIQTMVTQSVNNSERQFSTAISGIGYPIVANVRSGVVYGTASELTGTLGVPPKESVLKGVPVDDTVGEAILTKAAIQDAVAPILGNMLASFNH